MPPCSPAGGMHRRQRPKLFKKFGRLMRIRLHWGRVGGLGKLRGIVGLVEARLKGGSCLDRKFCDVTRGTLSRRRRQGAKLGREEARCKRWGVVAWDIP